MRRPKPVVGPTIVVLLLLVSAVPVSATPTAPDTVRCVNPGGTGGCFSTVQAAINASSFGDRVDVAAGTYLEHITLKDGVSIHGQGWDTTIIDGAFGSAAPTVFAPWTVSASTVLSGVQVTGGGTGTPATSPSGGGLSIAGSPQIVNTWVVSNTGYYGGGVYVSLGSPAFVNVPVWDNRALYGGGFYITSSPVVTVTGNPLEGTNGTIWLNRAQSNGGGVFIGSAGAVLAGLRIYQNSAGQDGGGVYIINSDRRVTLLFDDITGNTAHRGGGLATEQAMQIEIAASIFGNPFLLSLLGPNTGTYGGGGARLAASAGVIDSSWFFGNTTPNGDGGAIYAYGPSDDLRVTRSWFEGNTAYSFGGGLYLEGGAAPLIEANTFVTNTACAGAGLYASEAGEARVLNNILARNDTRCPALAAAAVMAQSPLRFINNTVALNTGDGVRFEQAEKVIIVNNIIYGNTGDGIEHDTSGGSTVVYLADYNDFFANANARNGLPPGAHDVALNPQFVNAGANAAARLHIQSISPVATLGSFAWAPPRDIDGEIRVFGGSVSMGADELATAGYSRFAPLVLRP